MKTLSIDIETYSDINLAKCGVYRYCESPAFEILLFAYSADCGPVQVVDLACGEKLPEAVKAALTDEAVTKYAFNASFERICLSRFLGLPTGEYLEPKSWRCTMVWSATMGLPLSLEGVGTVLGLEKQKLTEGKELIKYFCQPCTPTKSNGQRTRNKPFHAPEKSDFKRYNLRDVEVEIAIQQRLSKFPVSGSVWAEYHIDQEINDRGVTLDLTLVQTAIEMDTRSRKKLMTAMQKITALENPNSVQQMKQWLADNGPRNRHARQEGRDRAFENCPTGTAAGTPASPAACQILCQEVSCNGESSMCRWACPWNVPVLWCQPHRSLGRSSHPDAKPAAESSVRFGAGPWSGALRRLRCRGAFV